VKEFTLTTDDGVDLRAVHWVPARPSDTAIVLVHGFTASRRNPEVVAVAQSLLAAGYQVVSYDMRGHHDSGGECTLGDSERHDVAAAVAFARTVADRVVTVGASMGAIAVLRHASADATLDGVVTVSSPAQWKLPRNVRSVLAALMTRTQWGRSLAARHLKVRIDPTWTNAPAPEELVRLIQAPLGIVHGDADRMIPLSEAHRLLGSVAGRSRLDVVRGMGHAFHAPAIPAILSAVGWALTYSAPTALPA
jgi:pimeloyl-ACP methyl ester carboxylesterase